MEDWKPRSPMVLMSHAFLLLDGSGSMKERESASGYPKNWAVARMVQQLINDFKTNHEITDTVLTVICYDSADAGDIRVNEYNVKDSRDLYWEEFEPMDSSTFHGEIDPQDNVPNVPNEEKSRLGNFNPVRNHGGATPIGRALGNARKLAEEWILSAPAGFIHRAAICLMSDGMNYPPHTETDPNPDGRAETAAVIKFNTEQEALEVAGSEDYKGYIRIATVGYFQNVQGNSYEEDEGRKLLKALAHAPRHPTGGYFETRTASDISKFLRSTLAAIATDPLPGTLDLALPSGGNES